MLRCVCSLLLGMLVACASGAEIRDEASITGRMYFLKGGDPVVIRLYKYGYPFSNNFYKDDTIYVKDDMFKISFPVENADASVDIFFPNNINYNFKLYRVNAGDSVFISDKHGSPDFSGRGGERFRQTWKLQREIEKIKAPAINELKRFQEYFNALDSVRGYFLPVISGDTDLSEHDKEILRAEMITELEIKKRMWIFLAVAAPAEKTFYHTLWRAYLLQDYERNILDITKSINMECSQFFVNYVFQSYKIDSCVLQGKELSVARYYSFVKSRFTGEFRDKLITHIVFTTRTIGAGTELSALLEDADKTVRTPDLKNIVSFVRGSYSEGKEAYNFILTDTTGKKVRLSDFRGKVVLMDFWFNGCGNCRLIKPYLEKLEYEFRQQPVVFVAINIDKDRDQWLKGIHSQFFTSQTATQLYTNGNGESDPLLKHYKILGYPTVLIVGADGKMLSPAKDPRMDEGQELRERIDGGIKRINK
jgi:thiol-disulfide isomerase/thioredoxin